MEVQAEKDPIPSGRVRKLPGGTGDGTLLPRNSVCVCVSAVALEDALGMNRKNGSANH